MTSSSTLTYDGYLAYAKRLGVTPYTQRQWDRMSPTHKALLSRVAAA